MKKTVITISREYGSGGREIGANVARRLGIPFYDRKLINLAAEKSGLSHQFIEEREQKINSKFLISIAISNYSGSVFSRNSLLPEDKLFLTQSKVIRDIAARESCVIVERCADYILGRMEGLLNVFLYSDHANRMERAVREYGLNPATAEAALKQKDRARRNHYNHYTGQVWGELHNYHLAANTDYLGHDKVVGMIVEMAGGR